MASFIRAVLLVCVLQRCGAFYLPGLVPVNYCPETSAEPNCPVRTVSVLIWIDKQQRPSEDIALRSVSTRELADTVQERVLHRST